ncbi:unnamed protein product [Haemonchus placei]|uniref:Four helix bundle protein n=1 Tax=Haemonchus placei TaxID=6290 RepID=A0A0N4WMJ1_HAEPC|nr:unnamed protein product [Haemonchus placei]
MSSNVGLQLDEIAKWRSHICKIDGFIAESSRFHEKGVPGYPTSMK